MDSPNTPFYAYNGGYDESAEVCTPAREILDWYEDEPCPQCDNLMQFMVEESVIDEHDQVRIIGYIFCTCGYQEPATL